MAASWITRRWKRSGCGWWIRSMPACQRPRSAAAWRRWACIPRRSTPGWPQLVPRDDPRCALVRYPAEPRRLTDAQLGELADLITDTDPRDHGFTVALWTREIVRQLIHQRFGVELTVASVGRTLHELGFSAQRPLYRAEQADPAAVARWKQTEYPAIAAAARAAGGTVFFVDEAGVRSDYHAGTTW